LLSNFCLGFQTAEVSVALFVLQVLQSKLSPGTFRVLTSLIRTVNNILGGISFVVLAKVFGAQSSAGDEKKQSAKAIAQPAQKIASKMPIK
jgi:hypothetical protein